MCTARRRGQRRKSINENWRIAYAVKAGETRSTTAKAEEEAAHQRSRDGGN